MKRKDRVPFLLASLLAVSSALAQTRNSQATTDSPNGLPHQVAVARCAYSEAEEVCASPHQPNTEASDARIDTTLAQAPQRIPGPPMRGRAPMGRPRAYPGMCMEPGNGRHAAIGALIGFGLGAALGAKGNTDRHPGVGVGAAFLVGSIGAVLGAAVGYSTPSFRTRRPYRGGPWPDEDDAMASRKPKPPVTKATTDEFIQKGSPKAAPKSATNPAQPVPATP